MVNPMLNDLATPAQMNEVFTRFFNETLPKAQAVMPPEDYQALFRDCCRVLEHGENVYRELYGRVSGRS
jgi:hypothetical protein